MDNKEKITQVIDIIIKETNQEREELEKDILYTAGRYI